MQSLCVNKPQPEVMRAVKSWRLAPYKSPHGSLCVCLKERWCVWVALLTLSDSLCCWNSGQRPKAEDLEDNRAFCRRCERSLWNLHLLLHLAQRRAASLTSTPSRFHIHVLHDPHRHGFNFNLDSIKAAPSLVSNNHRLILVLEL